MRILLLTAAVLFAMFSTPLYAEKIRLRVTEFAPNYFLKDGQWTGLDVELAEAVIKNAGFQVEYVELSWSRALQLLRSGDLDMMANLTRTVDREAFIRFIGPARISKRVLVVRQENLRIKITNLDELAEASRHTKRPFGIQRDAKYTAAFDARLAADPNFARHFDAASQGAVLHRRVVASHNLGFFEDENYVIYQLQNNPEFQGLAVHPFTLAIDPVYFGLSKRLSEASKKKLEAAFERLDKNGTLAKIRTRWGKAQ
ncbi:MAG TPA: transporter substrate-binding domain-containing protein [Burkholderiales bacterium]|nr:transporter substrate-binding domain-containing protein [Burkholderiales bacterium]